MTEKEYRKRELKLLEEIKDALESILKLLLES